MQKLFAVIHREYMTRVRTKGFILSTVLMPLFIIFVTVAPAAFMAMKSESTKHIAVIDMSGNMVGELVKSMTERTRSGERLYQFNRIQVPPQSLEDTKRDLKRDIDLGVLHAYLVIPEDVLESNRVEYHSANVTNFRENIEIERALSRIVTRFRLEKSGLVTDDVEELVKNIYLATYKIGPGGREERDEGLSFGVTYIMIFFLYMALILYGSSTMRSVVEDKNNRVIEVILSAVKPFQLMAGKILGIGAVGLTQFFIWAIFAGLVSIYSSTLIGSFLPQAGDVPPPSIPLTQIIFFVVYFILGFFFYSTLYAGVGAIVNSDQEAQQLQWPIMSFLILAFMMVFYTMGNPDSLISTVFSLLPMFSPILMFMRISVHTPPMSQVALSIIILLLSIWAMIWIVSRIFRVGILMYGKRPNLPELMKWIRYR